MLVLAPFPWHSLGHSEREEAHSAPPLATMASDMTIHLRMATNVTVSGLSSSGGTAGQVVR